MSVCYLSYSGMNLILYCEARAACHLKDLPDSWWTKIIMRLLAKDWDLMKVRWTSPCLTITLLHLTTPTSQAINSKASLPLNCTARYVPSFQYSNQTSVQNSHSCVPGNWKWLHNLIYDILTKFKAFLFKSYSLSQGI